MPDGQTWPGSPDAGELTATVMVVVGAHLQAEEFDRPIAYGLCERIRGAAARSVAGPEIVRPVVCTDLWWLNDPSLRDRPTISIGHPEVNALTAYLADKLPTAFAIDGVLAVQLDVEFADPLAACWGVEPRHTSAAVAAFIDKYLDAFLQSSTY